MRRYETFVIVDPDLSQDQRSQVIQRVEELITQMDGFLVFTDDWGERKLAYDIKKRTRGYYVRFDYCGLSQLVDEIERFFRIDDQTKRQLKRQPKKRPGKWKSHPQKLQRQLKKLRRKTLRPPPMRVNLQRKRPH
jgi:ribosomal protein S6